MPLNVDIQVNSHQIETVWIGRMEHFGGPEAEHQYVAAVGIKHIEPWNQKDFKKEDLVPFTHVYSDGARECVRKALNALHEREVENAKQGQQVDGG